MSVILSVIIVNYNTFDMTCQCIESIITESHGLGYEIILVDNASTECNANDFLQRFPDLQLIALSENEGFGRANNHGMQAARGRYFCLLNSDTVVLDKALALCVAQMEIEAEDVGVLGAQLLNADGSNQTSYWEDENTETHRVAFRRGINHSFLLQKLARSTPVLGSLHQVSKSDRYEVGGLYGAFIFLRREVFEKLRGFDPDFFMYCEETEWFRYRIEKHYKTIFYAHPRIIHFGGESSKKNTVGWSERQNMASYLLYWYKLGRLKYVLFTLGLCFAIISNWLLYFTLSAFNRQRTRMYSYVLFRYYFSIWRYSPAWGSRPKTFKIN